MKRAFDIVAACVGLLILWPLMAAVALLVRICDGPPILFRHRRVGLHGAEFDVLKFRSMAQREFRSAASLTIGDDPRITPLGRRLRRLKLDELPQLINVLRGEMSIVGPRPETPDHVVLYTDRQRNVLKLRPGITDVASIRYFNESELLGASSDPQALYVQEIMPAKIELSLQYARDANVVRDVGVILKTLARMAA